MGNRSKQVERLEKKSHGDKDKSSDKTTITLANGIRIEKRKRRRKPGRKSLSEIKHAQRATDNCVKKAPLNRLLREIIQEINPELQVQREALSALRCAAEAFTIDRFKQAMKCTVNRNSQTLMLKDMKCAESIASHSDVNS